ncbi:KTSC domain-containing protein [Candidatus Bathyarchaeota archaeon]|nr:KTSC domain-containing protein [Candidatus Bathyarchaeota archaeon]
MSQTKWIQLESSQLDALKMQDGLLFVRFKNGAVYGYDWVDPEDVVDVLFPEEGSSHGKVFNKLIKGKGYVYQKLTEEEIESLG